MRSSIQSQGYNIVEFNAIFNDEDVALIIENLKLDNLIQPLFEKVRKNTQQIQTLQQTRDTLLPKLMSGKVRVDEFKE